MTASLRGIDIAIKIVQATPRDAATVQRLIEQKQARRRQAKTDEDEDKLRQEITALEWLRMIVGGSEQEWANWSLLG